MPRQARLKSSSGCYHIMVRGNAGASLFFYDRDKTKYLDLFLASKQQHSYKIFAFCLLDNQAHIVLQDTKEKISSIMHQINTGYAAYFRAEYFHYGHVFRGRFRSEPLNSKKHLLAAVRYVHNIPMEVKKAEKPEDYYWSSFIIYKDAIHPYQELININSLYVLLGWEGKVDIKDLHENKNPEELLCPNNRNIVVSAENLRRIWRSMVERHNDNKKAVGEFYGRTFLSIRELAQITGFSKSKIHRLLQ